MIDRSRARDWRNGGRGTRATCLGEERHRLPPHDPPVHKSKGGHRPAEDQQRGILYPRRTPSHGRSLRFGAAKISRRTSSRGGPLRVGLAPPIDATSATSTNKYGRAVSIAYKSFCRPSISVVTLIPAPVSLNGPRSRSGSLRALRIRRPFACARPASVLCRLA